MKKRVNPELKDEHKFKDYLMNEEAKAALIDFLNGNINTKVTIPNCPQTFADILMKIIDLKRYKPNDYPPRILLLFNTRINCEKTRLIIEARTNKLYKSIVLHGEAPNKPKQEMNEADIIYGCIGSIKHFVLNQQLNHQNIEFILRENGYHIRRNWSLIEEKLHIKFKTNTKVFIIDKLSINDIQNEIETRKHAEGTYQHLNTNNDQTEYLNELKNEGKTNQDHNDQFSYHQYQIRNFSLHPFQIKSKNTKPIISTHDNGDEEKENDCIVYDNTGTIQTQINYYLFNNDAYLYFHCYTQQQ